ncbi:hypothetical protein OESDEN_08425 [Oesophagostomum dentatum]|uniref:Uncharacterized protein n=1 Tax=Oesophagostomum dentatum TaxID=61180 RepID=A0A0B1T6G0_OESDE|nr:hypothetical protein OESDEN_08425 [Oesophagostomum dentatum]
MKPLFLTAQVLGSSTGRTLGYDTEGCWFEPCSRLVTALGVFLEKGCDYHFMICILLRIFGYIHGQS